MRIPHPMRRTMRMHFRFPPLLAGMILLCIGTASVAGATVLPAGQVSIVRDGNGGRWRCETQKAARAVCVRQLGAADPRRAESRAHHRVQR